MSIQESGEMYLETIYVLSLSKKIVRSIDVSEYMDFSKPSVSRAIKTLKEKNYVIVEPSGSLILTDTGLIVAKKMYERHIILSEILISLGVDKETAIKDACRIEHDISDTTFEAIKKHSNKFQK